MYSEDEDYDFNSIQKINDLIDKRHLNNYHRSLKKWIFDEMRRSRCFNHIDHEMDVIRLIDASFDMLNAYQMGGVYAEPPKGAEEKAQKMMNKVLIPFVANTLRKVKETELWVTYDNQKPFVDAVGKEYYDAGADSIRYAFWIDCFERVTVGTFEIDEEQYFCYEKVSSPRKDRQWNSDYKHIAYMILYKVKESLVRDDEELQNELAQVKTKLGLDGY
ncbi:hypothetical protein BKI52_12610 [marine bacterium AO1-C]|nr:hypothetical protein BKI52_12610 [marine bacterium AO1-C]